MNKKTLEAIKRAFCALSTDKFETATIRTSIFLERVDATRLSVTATDGYLISREILTDPALCEKMSSYGGYIVSRSSKYLVTLLMRDKRPEFDSEIDGATLQVSSPVTKICLICHHTEIPNEFARILAPPVSNDTIEIKFNPDLLARIYDALDGGKKGVTLTIDPKEKTAPIHVRVSDDASGVLMPMRR